MNSNDRMIRKRYAHDSLWLFCGSLVALGTGCASDIDDRRSGDDGVGRSTAAVTIHASWTDWISEEDGQGLRDGAHCSGGQVAIGFDCDGPFCDNVRLYCDDFEGPIGDEQPWSRWFEDGGIRDQSCPDGSWLTGVRCRGGNCDDISIRCRASSVAWADCAWTNNWHSEEDPPFITESSRYLVGIRCNGRHCDNKQYRYCSARPAPANSCADRCGSFSSTASCQCDSACSRYRDCCVDKVRLCGG